MKAAVAPSNRAITFGSAFKHTCSFIVFGLGLCGRISRGCLSGLGLGSVMQQQTIKQAKQALHNKAIKNRPQAGWTRRCAPRLLWRRYVPQGVSMHRLVIFFVILGLLFGCAMPPTYQQSGIESDEASSFAIVKGEVRGEHEVKRGLNEYVVFTELNGVSLKKPFHGPEYPYEMHISPGKHIIKVRYLYYATYADGCIELEVYAGERYTVRNRRHNYSVSFWAENQKGEVVGRVCGWGEEHNQAKQAGTG
jgi:hypothetical protein